MFSKPLFFLFAVTTVFAQGGANDVSLGRPSGDPVVQHVGFALGYSERHEQAAWVAYELTRWEAETVSASRAHMEFESDPMVAGGSAAKDDYRKSGFDKGHLAPAADMRWSAAAMRESFYLSNISPQRHEFNAGVWEDLEQAVRGAAKKLGKIDIVAGPVLRSGLPTIGKNRVSVPEYFYKVLYDPGSSQMIGFIMPNHASVLPFSTYAVTVDSVEKLTGLDFFNRLGDSLETAAESRADAAWWFGNDAPKRHHGKKHH
jgi:endonuclease G, mitochondrial